MCLIVSGSEAIATTDGTSARWVSDKSDASETRDRLFSKRVAAPPTEAKQTNRLYVNISNASANSGQARRCSREFLWTDILATGLNKGTYSCWKCRRRRAMATHRRGAASEAARPSACPCCPTCRSRTPGGAAARAPPPRLSPFPLPLPPPPPLARAARRSTQAPRRRTTPRIPPRAPLIVSPRHSSATASGVRAACAATRSCTHSSAGKGANVSLKPRSTRAASAAGSSGSAHASASSAAPASASASTASRAASRSTLSRAKRSRLYSITPSIPPEAPTAAESVSSTLAMPPPPPPPPPPPLSSLPSFQLTGSTSTSSPKPPPPSAPPPQPPSGSHASIVWKTALRDASCRRRGSSSCTSCWKGSAACAMPPTAASRAARSSAPTPISPSVPPASRPWYGAPTTTSSCPACRHSSSVHSASTSWKSVHPCARAAASSRAATAAGSATATLPPLKVCRAGRAKSSGSSSGGSAPSSSAARQYARCGPRCAGSNPSCQAA
eukprot:scaffold5648_cov69-Phaeocystis_antarctica.AAC.2